MAWYPKAIRKEITRHRTVIVGPRRYMHHTAVSAGASLFNYFNQPGNPTSHFYIRADGAVEQYVDTRYRAPAQLEGNHDSISFESQDMGGPFPSWSGSNVPAWTPQQVEAIAQIGAWLHKTHGIKLQMCPSSKPGTEGFAYHRQGVDPWRVSGGEKWSNAYGKVCPGDRRIAQIPGILSRAKQIVGGSTPPPPREDVLSEEVVLSALRKFAKEQQSVTGLVADTLPAAWNKSLYYLAGYGATSASPVGRERQASDVWNRPNPTLELSYGAILRFVLNAVRPDKSQTPGARVGFLKDLDRIEETAKAALAAVQGLDETQILARIDEHHAEVSAHAEQADAALQQLADRVDEIAGQAQAERAAILELVEQVGAGELAAERALELVRERLNAAGAALGDDPA